MSLICCPLQCGKFISSFQLHKNECPNKEKLGKFSQQCPYNPEHILSIKALKVHIHFCPNKPKSSIFKKIKPIKTIETLPLNKGFPPYDLIRPNKTSLNLKKKNIPISLSEGSLKETYNVFQRNKSMINDNYKRIKNQEKKLLNYYVDSEMFEEEKNQFKNNNDDIKDSKKILLGNVNKNSFLKKEYGYKIIKKTNSRGLEDKGTISSTSEDTFNQKKNFYW